jgi:glutathione S-transferase
VIELWHEWNSVHSFKVRAALAEKGLAWTGRRVELLRFEQLRPEYLRLNPSGVVPTLVHDGRVFLESSVICQYLDEAFPGHSLMPADPAGRAQARAWLKYFDDAVHPEVRRASFALLYTPLLRSLAPAELEARLASHPQPQRAQAFRDAALGKIDRGALRAALDAFARILARIDAALGEGPWLAGEDFGMADVAMAPFAERLEHLGLSRLCAPYPRALGWLRRVLERPSVVRAAAPAEFRFPPPPAGLLEQLLET